MHYNYKGECKYKCCRSMDWNVQWCRIGNNIIKITEISVLQMFVKGYPINIYNSTSVIINCVSFFVYIS